MSSLASNTQNEQIETGGILSPERRRYWLTIPAWGVSMVIHIALLLILAAVSLDPIQEVLSVLVVDSMRPATESEVGDFELTAPEALEVNPADMEMIPDSVEPAELIPESASMEALDPILNMDLPKLEMSGLTSQLTPQEMLKTQSIALSTALQSRDLKTKRELLEKYGGNKNSEQSVAKALQWLARHQTSDGSWNFSQSCGACNYNGSFRQMRNGATGLALLPFLGAGQTHVEGEFQSVVQAGLHFLLESMKVENRGGVAVGSWQSDAGDNMYGHGIASIAICEAYAMTKDPTLAKPAQLAINFIMYAQDPLLGGWRYAPRVGSDTSVVGWQLMALKSGVMGGLAVEPQTLRQAERFLDYVSVNGGAFYCYDHPEARIEENLATTACGLLCRMYMGWPKDHPGLTEGISYLDKLGPNPTNMYYNYYTSQVMKQFGGDAWERWNRVMRDQLVNSQTKEGHMEGSWVFEDHSAGNPIGVGGRLYITCMATMILEVYYRHMPIYAEQSEDDAFQF